MLVLCLLSMLDWLAGQWTSGMILILLSQHWECSGSTAPPGERSWYKQDFEQKCWGEKLVTRGHSYIVQVRTGDWKKPGVLSVYFCVLWLIYYLRWAVQKLRKIALWSVVWLLYSSMGTDIGSNGLSYHRHFRHVKKQSSIGFARVRVQNYLLSLAETGGHRGRKCIWRLNWQAERESV